MSSAKNLREGKIQSSLWSVFIIFRPSKIEKKLFTFNPNVLIFSANLLEFRCVFLNNDYPSINFVFELKLIYWFQSSFNVQIKIDVKWHIFNNFERNSIPRIIYTLHMHKFYKAFNQFNFFSFLFSGKIGFFTGFTA